jgi:hypothetical protein
VVLKYRVWRKSVKRRADRVWPQATLAILVGVGLAFALGYGGIWPQASPGATDVQLQHSLLVWSGFTANRHGRPVVLTGSRILRPADGFPDKTDQSEFSSGAIDAPASYPGALASHDGYGLISPEDAVNLMESADATGQRLRITKITLGTGTFQTDRGPRVLPAWLMWFAGIRDPAVVDATQIANPVGVATSATPVIESASLSSDKRRLTITYAASGHPCAGYRLTVAESHAAIAVAPIELHTRLRDCSAVRHSVITLNEPLAGRVLVDGTTGQPVTVLDTGEAAADGRPHQLLAAHRPSHRPARNPRVADHAR